MIQPFQNNGNFEKSTNLDMEGNMMNGNEQNSTEIRSEIFRLMNKTLGLDDLKTLCFMLGHEYDNLSGEGRNGKIRELILNVERQGTLKSLIATLSEYRPKVNWPTVEAEESTDEASTEPSEREIELIVRALNAAETRSNERMGMLAKELVENLRIASSDSSFPTIEGNWDSSVKQGGIANPENTETHIVKISQIGSSVTLEGESEEYAWIGDGRLISNLLIFRWELDNAENGINIMTVNPNVTIIDGKWFNHLGVSGTDIYERIND